MLRTFWLRLLLALTIWIVFLSVGWVAGWI